MLFTHQKTLLQKIDEMCPEKVRKINSDDQPWISHLTDQEQVELIRDSFSSIQNEYDPIQKDDIDRR